MKKFFTFLFGLSMAVCPLVTQAQDADMSFVFVDEEGEILEDGATVVRNTVMFDENLGEIINSGIFVLNISGEATDYIKMHYLVEQIDNGAYQICFPTTCNSQTEPGFYETSAGQLMGDLHDIQSEWFPTADGTCIVELSIEVLSKQGLFPPSYVHKADGPTLTLKFVKGDLPTPTPIKGDVNGDGEVTVSDVNFIIGCIVSPREGMDILIADVNGDGEVGIADINEVIGIILNASAQ